MAQWYVKDLSKLTGVSNQTLHHYDRIGLLKPSLRLDNGYRVYSEQDLMKLQQIIALKFFGFELMQIKDLLLSEEKILDSFSVQSSLLEQKAKSMLDASKALNQIISEVDNNKSLPWKTIIKLIEVYRMTQELENSWVKEIFNKEELQQYAAFQGELKAQPEKELDASKAWKQIVKEINANIQNDPTAESSIALGEKFMHWVNSVYGKKNANLRTRIMERGFGEGKGLEQAGLTLESVQWIDKAADAYWRKRIYTTLDKVGKESDTKVLKLWNFILDDMYGDEIKRKDELYKAVELDENISDEAKAWLKKIK